MERKDWLSLEPYSLNREEKSALYEVELTALTQHHRNTCPPYSRLLKALDIGSGSRLCIETVPMLPVSLFKEMELKSVSEDAVFKTLTSSGTTGQRVSRIVLDRETASEQQRVLSRIVSHFIGPKRLPLLILDSKSVLRDRAMFSARGAGILGFSIFGSPRCYALDEHMKLDLEGTRQFLNTHRGEKILLFGFTYMIWSCVIQALEERGEYVDISNGVLIHGGGWKKLTDQAVGPKEFKARVRKCMGVSNVHDYYGMAEQTGCIYMECPCGHLHTSVWSDILIRRPADFSLCSVGEPGMIETVSILPRSYPGHALLTEDVGILLGEDDCPCGRLGKYFSVMGRIPKAEIRGCSDTYDG